MEIQRLVTGAKLGNNDDYEALVRLYQRKLAATVGALVRDEVLAEDIVQDAFVKAWTDLGALREASAFPGWLWAIARNLARTRCRDRSRDRDRCVGEFDPEDHPDLRSVGPEDSLAEPSAWARVSTGLRPDQRLLLDLRHGAGLSLGQIGTVLGIPEQRVKSRLFTLRRLLEKRLGAVAPGTPPQYLEEKIMDKIATLRLGAHVFERLSLAVQADLAQTVVAGGTFGQPLLAALGAIDRGPDFLALYGTKIELGELIGVLNHVDRFTERRLVEHLEVVDSPTAERIKQNMFVFEDLVMFDPSAVRLMVVHADPEILAAALAGTELTVRHHILSALAEPDRKALEAKMVRSQGGHNYFRAAQEVVVNGLKDLEQSGELLVRRKGDLPEGEVYFTTLRA